MIRVRRSVLKRKTWLQAKKGPRRGGEGQTLMEAIY